MRERQVGRTVLYLVSAVASLIANLALGPTLQAQGSPQAGSTAEALEDTVPMQFSGRLVDSDGAPVAGAVVVSNAGGRAVSDRAGIFLLSVAVPAKAESVYLTAVGQGSHGSLSVQAEAGKLVHGGTTRVGVVHLTESTDCSPSWLPTFGQLTGTSYEVHALAAFDDGTGRGTELYVGGNFQQAGGMDAKGIARWNGTSWAPVGAGLSGSVNDLAVFDDGTGRGPALYAGGTSFLSVAGATVARWDGSSWFAVGNGPAWMNVDVLEVFDDGDGPALYAAGSFWEADGAPGNNIARLDDASWVPLGAGLNGWVAALAVFDDGGGDGPALHAGGSFTTAGGASANNVAKWDGAGWSPLGTGTSGTVNALATFGAPGGGTLLCAAGSFATAGGISAINVARWNGVNWSAMGNGLPSGARSLVVLDDGAGPVLWASGSLGAPLNKWNGSSWKATGSTVNGNGISVLGVFDDGTGPALFAGGAFTMAGGLTVNHVAKWKSPSWSALGAAPDDEVTALAVFDDGSGSGPQLYAGGHFLSVGSVPAMHIARWNGSTWSGVGSGIDGPVFALTVADDGSGAGPALYAGGDFVKSGGVTTNRIARWNGTSWSALGAGFPGAFGKIYALAEFDDGSGPKLYAGGTISGWGHVVRWNGASWSPVGGGMAGTIDPQVNSLVVFDDGSGAGSMLYAGGGFTQAGTAAASCIARWNGSSWSALGAGMDGKVRAMAVFDDGLGGGRALFAAGEFVHAGGSTVNHIAKLAGEIWLPVGGGTIGTVTSLLVCDEGAGSGAALIAGGYFATAGETIAYAIAKWNGQDWLALGGGLSGPVDALTVFDDGHGQALYAGGSFQFAFDSHDSHIAKWGGCPVTPAAWTNLGFALDGSSGPPLLAGTGTQLAGEPAALDLSHAKESSPALLFVGLTKTLSPFKGGTLIPIPAVLALSATTSPGGTIALPFAWPSGLPSGFSLYYQYAIVDAAAEQGIALSSALQSTTP